MSNLAETFWNGHYRQHQGPGNDRANPVLADVAGPLPPGAALDLGCGQGGDALWLARRGWTVTAVDVSTTVLARVAAQAAAQNASARMQIQQHDLSRTFPRGSFDLVSAQYLQSPVDLPREQILRRAATAVTPGGLLLVVTHASVPPWSWADPDTVFPTPEQALAALELDLDRWEVVRLDAPSRRATGPGDQRATVTDTVIAVIALQRNMP